MSSPLEDLEIYITKNIQKHWDAVRYDMSTDIYYEGQAPLKSIYLKSGRLELMKKNRVMKTLEIPGPHFLNELLYKTPLKYSIRITEGSEVYLIDRYSLYDIVKENFPDYAQIFTGIAS